MRSTFATKPVASIQPQTIANANIDGTGVDTKGFHDAFGVFYVGATTGNIDVLKVQESDDNSTWADISGASFSTLPGATDDNKTWTISIPLGGGRQRYLRWHASEDNTGSGIYAGVFNLGRAEEPGSNATFYGSGAHLNVT